MNEIHWQVPGNGNPFDSDLKDWKEHYMSQRSIGVLKFIRENSSISKSSFEENIWNYLAKEFKHKKNNSTISHFYRPLEFAGLIRRSESDILDLSIDGRHFLDKIEIEDYDRALDFYLLQLLKVRYPNTATPQVKSLRLFPFRIIFKLLLDYEKIDKNFFSERINYIESPNDIYDLFEENSHAHLRCIGSLRPNTKWQTWVISYLIKWNILKENNGFISLSDYKKSFISNLVSSMKYDDMFFEDETDETFKKLKIGNERKRDRNLAIQVLKNYNYSCYLDRSHKTFSTDNQPNFCEVHHIIPLSFQDSFEENLDSYKNLIPLCPNCHRAIHLSKNEYRIGILADIYKNILKSNDDFYKINLKDLIEIYS